MSAKDRVKLNIFTVALFVVCQTTQCIVLTVQYFCFRGNKVPSVPLSIEDKRVVVKFQENHPNNWRSPKNHIIPHKIDETLQDRRMKYPKIVETLDRMLYLTGKLGISYQGKQEAAAKQ